MNVKKPRPVPIPLLRGARSLFDAEKFKIFCELGLKTNICLLSAPIIQPLHCAE
jgi:hypothetical protein